MPTTRCNGINLYYETYGEPTAPPLVLIMGFMTEISPWRAGVHALAQDFHLVLFDNRGVGRSDRPTGGYSMADMAADTLALMDHLGLPSAHILGFSMGGMIAQHIALTAPTRVQRLVLGCTACVTPDPEQWIMPILEANVGGGRAQALLAGIPRGGVGAWLAANPDSLEQLVRVALGNRPPPAGFGQFMAIARHNVCARLGEIQAPTLVLHGTRDTLIAPRYAQQLAEGLPHARLEWIQGAGHVFFWEQPERVKRLVREFLLASHPLSPVSPLV